MDNGFTPEECELERAECLARPDRGEPPACETVGLRGYALGTGPCATVGLSRACFMAQAAHREQIVAMASCAIVGTPAEAELRFLRSEILDACVLRSDCEAP